MDRNTLWNWVFLLFSLSLTYYSCKLTKMYKEMRHSLSYWKARANEQFNMIEEMNQSRYIKLDERITNLEDRMRKERIKRNNKGSSVSKKINWVE